MRAFWLSAAIVATLLVASPALGRSLEEAWLSEAVPGDGYDKVLHLDADEIYTGGLLLTSGKNCIHGHGAVIDLQGGTIRVTGSTTRLDIDECILVGGGGSSSFAALNYALLAGGKVRNCVFFRNLWGLHMVMVWTNGHVTSIVNCIFLENDEWGAVIHDDNEYKPDILTCVGSGNGLGAFGRWCGCEGYVPFGFNPGNGCMYCDPMLENACLEPSEWDFHLAAGSPCFGTGTPAGVNIGAYPDQPVPVQERSWGQIKEHYRP
jgi:hypothetical protein